MAFTPDHGTIVNRWGRTVNGSTSRNSSNTTGSTFNTTIDRIENGGCWDPTTRGGSGGGGGGLAGLESALAQQTAIHAQIQQLAMESAIEKAWHDSIMQTINKL